ncbi:MULTISPECIES: ATP-binding protein [Enterobacter]|uniref:ATP-binding protein n=1 Tax=Enterobacter TaxID=547 RepID=UPI001ED93AC2|nr:MULTISPECIES: ATP-binding protein [Enterobacter]MCK6673051.1 ATP-binding protein [Enterobacter roggenkampii]MCK6928398.1 ATP-binding protein [Enterobacter roggenkampii]MCK7152544.1 ATP-binding protein [Enterobacter roggenkampii]UWI97597.1 ATP-binding protein [Enterobacter roggenkampii]
MALTTQVIAQLDEARAKIDHFHKIYVEWEFAAVDPMGNGIVLNFFGPPGTGKTLTAEALAGSLKRKIMVVSIADLESKFMGETAKNIAALFRQATEEEAVLFFDEADTLLGKRLSSVTQGIDNEVNAMRSTLLIELEKHTGIVIFATNFVKNYDSAFLSRISHHVGFTLPGSQERFRIWEKLLVRAIPLADARETMLESAVSLSEGLSGRDIRNAMRLALPKAVLESEQKLTLKHLESALAQIRDAYDAISNAASFVPPHINTAKKMLGLS